MTDPVEKPALRARMRALRAQLARDKPGASAQVLAWLPRLRGSRVAGYHGLGSELDPGLLMQALAQRGAALALPVTLGPSEPLIFRSWAIGEPLEPDFQGVPAPAATAMLVSPDIVIAPVLAFDRSGGRLGQGGGHYDRTLVRLRASGPLFVLGLAFAGQEIDEMPADPHDQKLDAILTETGYIEVKKP